MTPVVALFGGFAIVWGMTWLLWAQPRFLPLVDRPNQRSLHTRPTARTGGIAIAIGFTIAFAFVVAVPGLRSNQMLDSRILWIVVLAAPLFLTSLYNDWRELRPAVRLAIQLAVTVALVTATGVRLEHVSLPAVGSWSLGLWSVPVTVLMLVWMMNLYNFMDGMDGFAGGMAVFGFGFLACTLSGVGSLVAALIAACSLGFLAHNFPPARIFLGDTGSIPLGYLAGSLALFAAKADQAQLLQSALVFSPFIVDATVTLAYRLGRGERVWQPHRQHAYQRLVLAGWSHRKTVLHEYGLMLAAGVSALAYRHLNDLNRLFLIAVWCAAYTLLALAVRRIERRKS